MTHGRPDIQQLLASRGLRPRRALGQNFVADPNTVRRIARLAEVGPGDRGRGNRRRSGLPAPLRWPRPVLGVVALEVDAGLVEILASHLRGVVVGQRSTRAPGTCYYIDMNNRLCDVTGSSTQVLAQDVKSFDYNRKLIFWITLGDKLYVRNYESDKTKCLAHNIKKVVCVSKKIYVLTQSGRLSSLPSSSFEFIENVSWSCEASDVVDFYANSRQVVTVTVP